MSEGGEGIETGVDVSVNVESIDTGALTIAATEVADDWGFRDLARDTVGYFKQAREDGGGIIEAAQYAGIRAGMDIKGNLKVNPEVALAGGAVTTEDFGELLDGLGDAFNNSTLETKIGIIAGGVAGGFVYPAIQLARGKESKGDFVVGIVGGAVAGSVVANAAPGAIRSVLT